MIKAIIILLLLFTGFAYADVCVETEQGTACGALAVWEMNRQLLAKEKVEEERKKVAEKEKNDLREGKVWYDRGGRKMIFTGWECYDDGSCSRKFEYEEFVRNKEIKIDY